jgi:hypothetical protein
MRSKFKRPSLRVKPQELCPHCNGQEITCEDCGDSRINPTFEHWVRETGRYEECYTRLATKD